MYGKGNNCYADQEDHEGYYKDEDDDTWKKCNDTCGKCSGKTTCTVCAPGYHFIYNQPGVCVSDKPDDCYYDEEDDTYKKCYDTCGSCSKPGKADDHQCIDCAKYDNGTYKYHFVHDKPGMCISEDQADKDDYLDTSDNTYYDCYTSCGTCTQKGTSTQHNCVTCKSGYHWIYSVKNNCLTEDEAKEKYPYTYYNQTTDTFIYNQTGQCLRPCAKPDNTYLDESDDTYKPCYEKCATCNFGGNDNQHNCTECVKDASGNYLYHFIYNKPGQCVSIDTKGEDEYLDESDNTIKKCYETCGSCTKGGNSITHNCATCAKGYHWIYSQEGNCVNDDTKGEDTYYDEEDDTYKKCYDKCKKCNGAGDSEHHNCAACPSGYHFIFNQTGQCIPESEKCKCCYLDEEDDTYKECYERCETCVRGGDSNNHYCTECKISNGKYIYHFIYGKQGQCITDDEAEKNYYFDETDNTYKPCYERCATCSGYGTFSNMNCKSCASGYIFDEKTKKCLTTDESDQDGKYIEDGELKDCYSTCRKCKGAGTSEKNNCSECIDNYHFYYKYEGNCINEQPDHTYLDNTTNTYKECYDSCGTCTKGGDSSKHNCLTCIKGYHFIYTILGNCIPESERPDNTYYDEEDDTYKKCYDKCKKCSKAGDDTNHNCDVCNDNYHFIYNGGKNCYSESEKCDRCYLDEDDDTYKKCYETCGSCTKPGTSANPNCVTCPTGYHFIYNQTGLCIKEGNQPEDCYLDDSDNTYKKCYERCRSCYGAGSTTSHNCKECYVFENGTYKYHFTIDKEHQCISEDEAEHDYYLDNKTNTYEECHKNCYYCSKAGTDDSNNCNKCNTYYHFIYNKTGQCISENDKCTNCYLDESDDTYKLCYKTCGTCSAAGTDENPNCLKCASGYHFIYNRTNYCVKEGEQPENTYLDNDTDTYRKCYDSCSKCTTSGSTSCTQCAHG